MRKYYECHITLLGDKVLLKKEVEALKWIFSCIDGDIVLGEGVKCYATMHYSFQRHTEDDVINYTNAIAAKLFKKGINPLRRKVELVLYDTKTFKLIKG